MSVNRFISHLIVLPEDDANRQLANGFLLGENLLSRRIQVMPEVGGWNTVLDTFCSYHAQEMDRYEKRYMALLIDFDGDKDRREFASGRIPAHLKERVFIIGAFTEPEDLKPRLGSFERIGMALAKDCRENTATTWDEPLLRHNATELERLRNCVRSFLFN